MQKNDKKTLLDLISKRKNDAANRREMLPLSEIEMTSCELKLAWFSLLAREMAFDEIKKALMEM